MFRYFTVFESGFMLSSALHSFHAGAFEHGCGLLACAMALAMFAWWCRPSCCNCLDDDNYTDRPGE